MWAAATPERIGAALDVIATAARVVSVVSIWELATKQSLGKVDLGDEVGPWFARARAELDLTVLEITATHAAAVEQLPRHHRDPFDRMLLAQARAERLRLMTADETLAAYDADVLVIR
jgi:PIN domain nuclease of toxin-antitoxin system